MEKSINIWTPIRGLNKKNTLLFIPGSQDIPENDIVTVQENDPITKKGSTGNVIGFLYSPKYIVSGVNFDNSSAMNVPDYHSSIFPGLLIHGSGGNSSSEIRISLDFRILPLSAYIPSKSKQLHMASNKPYFELL
jgi:ectoine hydroxylase-related dioxygenase (phytanoyl-CoA dioxygenase family)